MPFLFTASYPQRVSGLILTGSYVKRIRSDEYPWAPTWDERQSDIARTIETWGDLGDDDFEVMAPSRAGDPAFRAWVQRYMRLSASPRAAGVLMEMNSKIDVISILPTIQVPTLLLYRKEDRDVLVEEGRDIASRIPGARLVELPGADHLFWAGNSEEMLGEIEEFVTGHAHRGALGSGPGDCSLHRYRRVHQRRLELGRSRRRDLLDRHNEAVRSELARWQGVEIDATGDGFLARFDGPARAIRCATSISQVVRQLGTPSSVRGPHRRVGAGGRPGGRPRGGMRGQEWPP